jgi:hypothetical protein
LRVGLALVIGILGLVLVMDKAEQVAKQQKEYRRLSITLEQARQQATDTSWIARSKAANESLAALRERDWTDSSNGLIQSKWNDALQTLLTQEQAGNPSVTLSESVAEPGSLMKTDDSAYQIPGMTAMRAKLRFEAMPKSLYTILQILESNKQTVVVDTLNYQWLGTIGRAEVNLRTFTRVTDPAAKAATVKGN